jgi:hypothetical protein
MKLYTIISIALSLFGATYAAMAALRTRFEKLITTAEEDGQIHLKKIIEHYGKTKTTADSADKHLRWICRASKLWNRCNTVPTIMFAFFVFVLAFWFIIRWNYLAANAVDLDLSNCPITETCFYFGLLVLVVVDAFCFIGAACAWGICRLNSRILRQQYDTALEDEEIKIKPV